MTCWCKCWRGLPMWWQVVVVVVFSSPATPAYFYYRRPGLRFQASSLKFEICSNNEKSKTFFADYPIRCGMTSCEIWAQVVIATQASKHADADSLMSANCMCKHNECNIAFPPVAILANQAVIGVSIWSWLNLICMDFAVSAGRLCTGMKTV